MPLCFAYYCSGHGYGHATRVSAFACHLLSLPEPIRPTVYITSSAPMMVFSEAIACGAKYRESLIDPVIVQPVAYQVDRKRSVEVLKDFLHKKPSLLSKEIDWLKSIQASCILTDAAFLGCLAGNALNIPSILITNFSFDAIYSFLATPIPDSRPEVQVEDGGCCPTNQDDVLPDEPINVVELHPLVQQIWEGYRCADLLLLLPGHIPIPSFWKRPSLPASEWVNPVTCRPYPELESYFGGSIIDQELHGPHTCAKDACLETQHPEKVRRIRMVKQAPLVVRPPSKNPSPYSQDGRSKLLAEIGVPFELHDLRTKIVVVSFGGQVFQRPSSRSSPSRSTSPDPHSHKRHRGKRLSRTSLPSADMSTTPLSSSQDQVPSTPSSGISTTTSTSDLTLAIQDALPQPNIHNPQPIATPDHFFIPGAPPVSRLERNSSLRSLTKSPTSPRRRVGSFSGSNKQDNIPTFHTTPPTPLELGPRSYEPWVPAGALVGEDDDEPIDLLPNDSWIAIICGVSKEQWLAQQAEGDDNGLPDRFFVAPRDVYMPDLTAIGDVLLGKLGYGTVSECIDACTAFVYVSRPLFIEEHGLRQYLTTEGTGVELSRACYELGDWAWAIQDAYQAGKQQKAQKRRDMAQGVGIDTRKREVQAMAMDTVTWVDDWYKAHGPKTI